MASPSGKALYLLSSSTEQTPEDDALCLLSLGQNPKQEICCYQAQVSLHRSKMRSVLPGLQEHANPKASSQGRGVTKNHRGQQGAPGQAGPYERQKGGHRHKMSAMRHQGLQIQHT